jgi:four helix bundle protein
MSNDGNGSSAKRYDLEARTALFGEAVIAFARKIPVDAISGPLIQQLVKSGTSVGANYCEADDAGSRTEFKYRISFCKRESRESKYWLQMIAAAIPDRKYDARTLWREAKELHLIFASIFRSASKK